MNNKKQLSKIILLLFLFVLTNIFIVNPIKERKEILETEKYKIDQEMKEVEKYKKQTEVLKKEKENKKNIKLFKGKDDIIEIQNTINNIVKIQSIENLAEFNENGERISNIDIKFIGTYKEIFKVIDALKIKGVGKMIKSISISRINSPNKKPEETTKEKSKQASKVEKIKEVRFECTLKVSKI